MKRAAFLDRDGVINRKPVEGEYVTQWEQLQILPGVAEAITRLNQASYLVIVITNQRCVAKGLITIEHLNTIHRRLCEELGRNGARIDAIYYCPHDTHPPCDCRKPAPGLIHQAAAEHGLSLSASWMIGDSDIDIQAGNSAGCKTVKISEPGEVLNARSDANATSLLDAAQHLLAAARVNAER